MVMTIFGRKENVKRIHKRSCWMTENEVKEIGEN